MSITLAVLRSYEEAHISDICQTGYVRNKKLSAPKERVNHCAHFVSHVLGLRVLTTGCGNVRRDLVKQCRVDKGHGVTVRVNELFNTAGFTKPWYEGECLSISSVWGGHQHAAWWRRYHLEAGPYQDTPRWRLGTDGGGRLEWQRNKSWHLCDYLGAIVYVTQAGNMRSGGKRMHTWPKKHVGLTLYGDVWHYSNTSRKVVCWSAEKFRSVFRRAYGPSAVYFLSDIHAGANPRALPSGQERASRRSKTCSDALSKMP